MPPKKPQTRGIGKLSLSEQLGRWADNPDENSDLIDVARDSFESAQKSYGFDKSATTTQNRRSRHLKEYELFMTGMAKKEGKEANHELFWGTDNIELQLRAYIAFAANLVQPRSYSSESIKFQTLVQRRQSMIFWITRKCADQVSIKKMWHASQEALHSAFRTFNVATTPAEKLYMTKFDLVKLIEHDMYTTTSSDNAQQHHLAWLLGYMCGVRPGSIGTSRKRTDQFLQWKDVSVFRIGAPGSNNFRAKITFRWLKGYRDEENRRTLTFSCDGPSHPEDAIYSIPHRLVALLLRRGLFEEYSTVQELLGDTRTSIVIKKTALDLPVICASSPKGLDIKQDTPASCDAISAYVHRRALDYGLPSGITHYAWRRSAGTKMAAEYGPDKAREFLGHQVNTRTFETAYNQGMVAIDVLSVALGRITKSADVLLQDEAVAVNRIKVASQSKDKWIERYIKDNDEYRTQNQKLHDAEVAAAENAENMNSQYKVQDERRQFNSIRRSLRAQGLAAFQRVQLQLTQNSLTQEQLEVRRLDVQKAGEIQQMLLDAAADARVMQENLAASRDDDLDEEQDAGDLEAEDLQDVRDRLDSPGEPQNVEVPNMSLNRTNREDLEPDEAMVAASCKTLLEVLTGLQDTTKERAHCRLCLNDPNVDEEKKQKTYMPGELSQHQGTGYHSPASTFKRRFKGKEQCPFGCDKTFTANALLKHVHEDLTQSDEHLLSAARQGLFARDFDPRIARHSAVKTRVVDGKAVQVMDEDPEEVNGSDMIRPRNMDIDGNRVEPSTAAGTQQGPTLLLPTNSPLIDTQWWKEHDVGVYGHVADTLQAQRRWIMERLDSNIRNAGIGRAMEGGETRKKPKQLARRQKTIPELRKRLVGLGWDWAEDEDNVFQPEDEEDVFEGFSDNDRTEIGGVNADDEEAV